MAIVEDWTLKLAEQLAPLRGQDGLDPAERERVRQTAQIYMEGGRARYRLLAESRTVHRGMFLDSIVMAMPSVLNALSFAAPKVMDLFTSPHIESFLGIVSYSLDLAAVTAGWRAVDKEVEGKQGKKGRKPSSPAAAATVPAEESYTPLRDVMHALVPELQRSGMSQDQAELAAFKVLKVLIEGKQEGGERFVRALEQSGTDSR